MLVGCAFLHHHPCQGCCLRARVQRRSKPSDPLPPLPFHFSHCFTSFALLFTRRRPDRPRHHRPTLVLLLVLRLRRCFRPPQPAPGRKSLNASVAPTPDGCRAFAPTLLLLLLLALSRFIPAVVPSSLKPARKASTPRSELFREALFPTPRPSGSFRTSTASLSQFLPQDSY